MPLPDRRHNRRQFLSRTIVLPSLVCKLYEQAAPLLHAQVGGAPPYDLLIRGGRVIDPSQGLSAETDIAIRQGKVARVAANIAESQARQVLDARRMIVTPGLVDVHVHVYDGVAPLGIPADPNCIAKGRNHRGRCRFSRSSHVPRVQAIRGARSRKLEFTPCSISR